VIELHGEDAIRTFKSATASLKARRWKHGENDIVLVNRPE
jgi:hypothetical protein